MTEHYINFSMLGQTDQDFVNKLNICAAVYTVIVAVYGLILPAPYGRYYSENYGLLLPANISWMIQECPSVLVPIFLVLTIEDGGHVSNVNLAFFGLFVLHYVQRAFVQPFLSVNAKKIPLLVSVTGFIFTSYNGFMQTFDLLNVAKYDPDWFCHCDVIMGLFLFLIGMAINIYHDHLLRNLRKPDERTYKIPTGGLFNYVSCANYFGEIVEWWGFWVCTHTSSSLILAVFTTLFLGSRAFHHHRYYKEKFEDYPSDRKAVIPFIL